MLNFSKFSLFISILVILPILVNIAENLIKIFNSFTQEIFILSEIVNFDNNEFCDFVLEFLDRAYDYKFEIKDNDIYLYDKINEWFLYSDNKNDGNITLYDIRNIIGICESKGCRNVFIFTTGIISENVRDFLNSFKGYNFKYIHGGDLKISYIELVDKFYC